MARVPGSEPPTPVVIAHQTHGAAAAAEQRSAVVVRHPAQGGRGVAYRLIASQLVVAEHNTKAKVQASFHSKPAGRR